MPSPRSLALASVLAALLPSAAAAQQPTIYTNRTAWENAVQAAGIPITTIDFEGIASGPVSVPFPTGFTQAGVTFVGAGNPSPNVAVVDAAAPAYAFWGSGAKLITILGFGRSASPAGSISLPAGVRAFALTYTATCSAHVAPSCGSSPWTLRLDGGAPISIPGNPAPPGLAFVGVLAASPLARLELDPSASIPLIGDFWFGPGTIPTYLTLQNGNPGGPADGIVVGPTSGPNTYRLHETSQIPLSQAIRADLRVTVFAANGVQLAHTLGLTIGRIGTPQAACLAMTTAATRVGYAVRGGVTGSTYAVSAAWLDSRLADMSRQSPACPLTRSNAGVLSVTPTLEQPPTGVPSGLDALSLVLEGDASGGADLSLSLTPSTSEVIRGTTVPLDLTIQNLGSLSATSTRVRTELPSGLQFVGSESDSRCTGSTIVTCSVGSLGSGVSAHVRVALRTASAGRLSATFVASTSTLDPSTVNDRVTAAFAVLPTRIEAPTGNLLVGTLRRDRPTIILTHGWSPASDREAALRGEPDLTWTGTGNERAARLIGDELARRGQDANIVQFVWPGAFTFALDVNIDYWYQAAYTAAFPAGLDLGRRLVDELGSDYAHDIQFIGHSLGSAVNAYGAAYFLRRSTRLPRLRFTALDRPDRVPVLLLDFQEDFFVSVLHPAKEVSPATDVVIENYYSNTGFGVGDRATGSPQVPAYNHLPLSDPDDIDRTFFGQSDTNDHSGVQAWYRLTIAPQDVRRFDERAYCDGGHWRPRSFFDVGFRLLSNSLDPCQRGWTRSLFGAAGALPEPYDRSWAAPSGTVTAPGRRDDPRSSSVIAPYTAMLDVFGFSNIDGCALNASPQSISCTETAAAMAQASLEIPTDSAYLSFEYRFAPAADGEHAVVMIDDRPVWTMNGTGATGAFESVASLPIRGLSGLRALTVAFYGAGAATGQFELRSLAVTSGSPERRYLAEGATGTFFDTKVALFNPHEQATNAVLRFAKSDGTSASLAVPLAAHARTTVELKAVEGLASANVSTTIESGLPIVVDRRMSWDGSGYGSHAERATEAPSTVWYLAEGSTSGDFALFYLLQNPQAQAVDVVVRYLLPFGQTPIERTYTLRPNSRTTIPVDSLGPPLDSTDVSAVVTAAAPIIVERAMYRSSATQVFAAGHGSAGVTNPSTEWFLAEGATGPFFDLFVLFANPHDTAATVRVDYLLSTGETYSKNYVVPPNGRYTVWVDAEEVPGGSGRHPLANVAVSVTAVSTNGVPIIVERTMWWPGPESGTDYWYEAHNSAGATATGTRWALADGETGGSDGTETYVLIANTSATPGTVRVRLFFDDGEAAERVIQVAPRSRTNVNVSVDFPEASGRRFGALVESIGDTPAQIVVERAMYGSPTGRVWAAGTGALATRLQ